MKNVLIIVSVIFFSSSVLAGETVSDVCGNVYPVVTIGDQTWMAENMRCNTYDTNSEANDGAKKCNYNIPKLNRWNLWRPHYIDIADKNNWYIENDYTSNLTDEQICKLGYFYTWFAAVGLVGKNALQITVSDCYKRQGVCPNGWHIPTKEDWDILISFIENADGKGVDTAAKHLKSDSGWYQGGNFKPGVDTYGFKALPSGDSFCRKRKICNVGLSTSFWTATKQDGTPFAVYCFNLSYSFDNIFFEPYSEYGNLPVRCIKD